MMSSRQRIRKFCDTRPLQRRFLDYLSVGDTILRQSREVDPEMFLISFHQRPTRVLFKFLTFDA